MEQWCVKDSQITMKMYFQLLTSLTHSHPPFKFSFHSVTFPSPQLTASTFPARLHETRHTTSGNLPGVAPAPGAALTDGSSAVLTHGAVGVSFVHTSTVLSCSSTASQHQRTGLSTHTSDGTEKNLPATQSRCTNVAVQCSAPRRRHVPSQHDPPAHPPPPRPASPRRIPKFSQCCRTLRSQNVLQAQSGGCLRWAPPAVNQLELQVPMIRRCTRWRGPQTRPRPTDHHLCI